MVGSARRHGRRPAGGSLRTLSIALLVAAGLALAPAADARLLEGFGLLGRTAERGSLTLGGRACRLLGVPAAAPVGIAACPGVRPGAAVRSEAGLCTFNFLFAGSDGRRYIGTAGHCILGDGPAATNAGEILWAPGTGPAARDAGGGRVGEFAYAILEDPKDFALVRLDPGVAASPQVCHFGGPTGLNADLVSGPVLLQHYGQGLGLGLALPARTSVALGMPSPDHVFAVGVVAPGDSGSGAITADGRAVGVITTLGVHAAGLGTSGVDAGTVGITRLGPQVSQAEGAMGIGLGLQTAPGL